MHRICKGNLEGFFVKEQLIEREWIFVAGFGIDVQPVRLQSHKHFETFFF